MSRTAATPERSMEQRMDALRKANVRRMHRASVKRALARGEAAFFDVLDDPLCDTMKVRDVLLALPGLGEHKVEMLLFRARLSPAKTCAGATTRQRVALAGLLGDRGLRLRS